MNVVKKVKQQIVKSCSFLLFILFFNYMIILKKRNTPEHRRLSLNLEDGGFLVLHAKMEHNTVLWDF